MKKSVVLMLTLLLLVVMSGCSAAQESPTLPPAEKTTSVQVSLEENPSTGCTWSYTADVPGILTETKNEFVPGESEADKTGVPGTRVYTFEAAKDGTVKLTFVYEQNDDSGSTQKTISYTYEVKDGSINNTGFSSENHSSTGVKKDK